MQQYQGIIAAHPQEVADKLAVRLVEDIRNILAQRDVAQVVFSTGATPMQTYSVLRTRYRSALAWERVTIVQLDEYCDLPPDDPRRFSTFLRQQLAEPLGTRHRFLSGDETEEQLAARDTQLRMSGGLDLVLFGVGVNGHLGFNEPGSPIDSPSRRVALHATTRERIDTQCGPAPGQAVTLGMATLHAARRIRVVALGAAKRDAVARGLLQPAGIDSPLSSLQAHHDVAYFIDADAAPEGLLL